MEKFVWLRHEKPLSSASRKHTLIPILLHFLPNVSILVTNISDTVFHSADTAESGIADW